MVQWVARHAPFTRRIFESELVFAAFFVGIYGILFAGIICGALLRKGIAVPFVDGLLKAFVWLLEGLALLLTATTVVGFAYAGFTALKKKSRHATSGSPS